jgi:hypothetical protein
MPISITRIINGSVEKIAWLCDGEWELPRQIDELKKWLLENRTKLNKGNYVADVGYSPREDACGGGAVLSIQAMRIMVAVDMELYLSEYSSS